jgi:cathepsin L
MSPLGLKAALLALGAPVAGALSLEVRGDCGTPSIDFSAYVEKYGRSYLAGTEEYAMRQGVFENRAARIASHNCDPAVLHRAEINHLTDWTPQELATLRGHKMTRRGSRGAALSSTPFLLAKRGKGLHKELPQDFGWGHLEAMKQNSSDQGTCGSCWAHASRLSMQARAEIKGLKNIQWATHQLIACTPNPKHCGGEGGCDGATAELAYEYVINKGLMQASEWRAQNGDNQTAKCPKGMKVSTEVATRGILGSDGSETHRVKEKTAGHALGMKGWMKLPENKEDMILKELYNNGPVYVAVAAGDGWFDYKSGVMTEDSCDRDFIVNHAVVLFAWGVKQKTVRGPVKYWQIKNSWGPQWGEQGTGRFIRTNNEESVCGYDEDPQQGSGCDNGPERVWVCGTCGILYDVVVPHF